MVVKYKVTVIYVPPMSGSETRVWNAEIPTNCTVLIVKEKKLHTMIAGVEKELTKQRRTTRYEV